MSKIDEGKLLDGLRTIATTMQEIAQATLAIAGSARLCYKEINEILQTGTIPSPMLPPKQIPNFFPDPYADMMRIELDIEENVYRAYPVKFLGTDNFKQIADIVQKLGGAYVKGDKTQGVKAHFTIPKGENKP